MILHFWVDAWYIDLCFSYKGDTITQCSMRRRVVHTIARCIYIWLLKISTAASWFCSPGLHCPARIFVFGFFHAENPWEATGRSCESFWCYRWYYISDISPMFLAELILFRKASLTLFLSVVFPRTGYHGFSLIKLGFFAGSIRVKHFLTSNDLSTHKCEFSPPHRHICAIILTVVFEHWPLVLPILVFVVIVQRRQKPPFYLSPDLAYLITIHCWRFH